MSWNEGAPVPPEMSDNPVSQALGGHWDGGDPWGSAMAEAFALCDFVTFYLGASEEIPDELQYQSSPFGADTESPLYVELVEDFGYQDFTAADAFEYLPILNRYLDACKAAGLDY